EVLTRALPISEEGENTEEKPTPSYEKTVKKQLSRRISLMSERVCVCVCVCVSECVRVFVFVWGVRETCVEVFSYLMCRLVYVYCYFACVSVCVCARQSFC